MTDHGDRSDGLEIASAIILSVAALASSWATYQASLWDGEQAANYSRANALRIQASRAALEGDAMATVHVQMFTGWLDARARGDERLAAFYQARFPPDMKPAFNAWIAERPLANRSASPTPFASSAYSRPGSDSARELDLRADQSFAAGEYDNAVSDAFQQGSTLLAIALFFGGIMQVFRQKTARTVLLVVAGAALVGGLIRLFSLPLQVLGLQAPA